MGNPREGEGGSNRVPVAHNEIRRPEGGVPVRAPGESPGCRNGTGRDPYDSPGAELFHYKEGGDERCSFDAIIKKYKLTDPALLDMAEIVRTADAGPRNPRPEGAGLEAMALGFRENSKDDFENMRLQFPAYNALYTYCRLKVEGKAKLEHAPR